MVGADHGDLDVPDVLRAAFVHLGELLHAFLAQPTAQLGNADNFGIVLFCDFNCIADVVAVAMGAQHDVNRLDFFFVRRTCWISHYPGIDQDGLSFGSLNAEGCVSEPGELYAVQFHGAFSFYKLMIKHSRHVAEWLQFANYQETTGARGSKKHLTAEAAEKKAQRSQRQTGTADTVFDAMRGVESKMLAP